MSLRLRLTLTYGVLVAAIIIIFSLVLYTTLRRDLEAEMDRRLEVRASQVQLTIWPGTTSLSPEDLTSARLDLSPLADIDAPGLYVQVLDRDGAVVATSDNLRGAGLPTDQSAVSLAAAGRFTLSDVALDAQRRLRVLSLPITVEGAVVGVLQVGQSRQPLQDTMANLGTLLALLGSASLAVAGVVGWLVAYRGLRPLSAISRQAELIADRRDFSRRLGLGRGRDEVSTLARTIDGLLATVEDTLRTHREFVADTSHELRNPLLAIRTNLELLGRVSDPAARQECVREARQQVVRMSRLVADLLLLAQVEAGRIIEPRPVELRPLLERVVHNARKRAAGRQVQLEHAEDLVVLGDEDRLTQVLENLVDNALRYTPPDGTIGLRLDGEQGWACLSVRDTGAGIAPEDLPRVFDRFFRSAGGRAAGDGIGLGLAIVKHLVEAHGGRVAVASEPGQGSRFRVWLPMRPGLAPPAAAMAGEGAGEPAPPPPAPARR